MTGQWEWMWAVAVVEMTALIFARMFSKAKRTCILMLDLEKALQTFYVRNKWAEKEGTLGSSFFTCLERCTSSPLSITVFLSTWAFPRLFPGGLALDGPCSVLTRRGLLRASNCLQETVACLKWLVALLRMYCVDVHFCSVWFVV